MTNRRDFCKTMGALGVAAATSDYLFAQNIVNQASEKINDKMIWAYLIHLGLNLWDDYTKEGFEMENYPDSFSEKQVIDWAKTFHPFLRCDMDVWDKIIDHLAASGGNMVVIDLADGVKYASHPEISVKGALTPKVLKKVLAKIRKKGIEPIPKLNFSACHKAWMGDYQYRICSESYYGFCQDLIEEVIDIFDKPRFFHLGMDEETCSHQSHFKYSVVRNGDLWWHDFYFFMNVVEKHDVRPWIWSDYLWYNRDLFLKKMPKSVLQSNWDYEESGAMFDENNHPINERTQAFIDLEEYGYDQIPTGSLWLNGVWENYENADHLVKHGKRIIAPERLKGFMQTVWMPTLKPCLNTHYKAIDIFAKAKNKYY